MRTENSQTDDGNRTDGGYYGTDAPEELTDRWRAWMLAASFITERRYQSLKITLCPPWVNEGNYSLRREIF
jgi:hypothetical protein